MDNLKRFAGKILKNIDPFENLEFLPVDHAVACGLMCAHDDAATADYIDQFTEQLYIYTREGHEAIKFAEGK